MSAHDTPITLTSVGTVHCDVDDDQISKRRRELVSVIEIKPEFAAGLRGIEAYSHLFVLFWMDRAGAPASLLCHPRGDTNEQETGVFAARGRNHPNSIGLAVVELLDVEGNRLRVRKLDAYDGTPILDIKPYDDYDVVAAPRVADWFARRQNKRS